MTAPADPERVYAIGDIHGWIEPLTEVHAAIGADLASRPVASHAVVHIGDYCDRGPATPEVIEFLLAGEARGAPWVNLFGNHDRMFLRFLDEPGGRDERLRPDFGWLHPRLGGRTTLEAYGLALSPSDDVDGAAHHAEAAAAIPAGHIAFLRRLRLTWRWRDIFFTHAGVRPGVALEAQSEDDLIWIRDEFHHSRADHGALIVHGHTPVKAVEDHGNRIAIDTGAAYGGPLSCVIFEGEEVRVLSGPRLR